MPIEVYTGKPGNGKTALMMERLMAEAEKGARPIFAGGIEGLQPGLATVLDDPRTWNDKDDQGNYLVPNGSLIFIDEAWKWFGHLHDATRQSTPPHVLALAEHRHRGIDFVWTTQGPNQLYPFTRNLIADHFHCVRRFGTKFIDVFKWEELNEDIKSAAKREAAQRTTRTLPEKSFGKYKSAAEHTIKPKIPLKVLALPLLVLAAAGLLYLAYNSLRPEAMAATMTAEGTDAAPAASAPTSHAAPTGSGRRVTYASTEEYVAAHQARIGSLPWSAPIFDGRAAQSDPEVYCISSGEGLDVDGNTRKASVICLTEQGTRHAMDERMARQVARWGGAYNPYKRAQDERAGRVEGDSPSTKTDGAKPAPGASSDAPQSSGVGVIAPSQPQAAPR